MLGMAYRQQRIRALAAERLGFHEAYRAPARIKTEDACRGSTATSYLFAHATAAAEGGTTCRISLAAAPAAAAIALAVANLVEAQGSCVVSVRRPLCGLITNCQMAASSSLLCCTRAVPELVML